MSITEPCIRAAAVLTSHWLARDMEAVILLLAEVGSRQEAEDLVVGLLLTRDLAPEVIASIVRSPYAEEASG